ncbi:AraC-type DNA-binding protein [Variovorax sp. OK605]|uniref:helix-turn-helix domain-containing protein n=1 Tax=Variovorax sp. OK605 TaxID=1855317 RepID=UPI0008E9524E|nr:AraC family transcriptional regulator [Variovorax sp. OK605]SFP84894.1 AraC-type DNA-binding protein [Variovorax sp. OK605]
MDMPFSLPSAHALESARSWGRTQGLTLTPIGRAQGRREFLCFRPGFYVALGHVNHVEPSREVYRSGDFIKLHFRLEGESFVGQPGAVAAQTVSAMSVSTLLQPPGLAKEECFAGEVKERSVTLCCSRSFLMDELGLSGETLRGPFGTFVRGAPQQFELARFPIDAAQYDIALALLGEPQGDAFRGIYAESKAFALLHTFLTRRFDDAAPDTAGARTRERLMPVKRYIDANLHEALEMRNLAKRFGFSESHLARRFREVFGVPLFEYVGNARLTRARGLIEDGRLSIAQIALEVGYGHAANFSTAFKRQFGMTPQGARRGMRQAH